MQLGVGCILHVDHLREQREGEGGLLLVRVVEGRFKLALRIADAQIFGNRVVPVDVHEHAGHLILSCKLVNGGRDHIFLTMAVEQDDLAVTRIPEACQNLCDVIAEGILIDGDRAGHAHVVVGMRAEPDRLGNGAAGLLCNLLRHARDKEGVLAVAGMRTVALGRADRKNENIVLLQALFALLHGHVLKIDRFLRVHVACDFNFLRVGNLPFAHDCFLLFSIVFFCSLTLYLLR